MNMFPDHSKGIYTDCAYLGLLAYNHSICFGTAFTSDVMSQLNSREREGAADTKNPDPYYSGSSSDNLLEFDHML